MLLGVSWRSESFSQCFSAFGLAQCTYLQVQETHNTNIANDTLANVCHIWAMVRSMELLLDEQPGLIPEPAG